MTRSGNEHWWVWLSSHLLTVVNRQVANIHTVWQVSTSDKCWSDISVMGMQLCWGGGVLSTTACGYYNMDQKLWWLMVVQNGSGLWHKIWRGGTCLARFEVLSAVLLKIKSPGMWRSVSQVVPNILKECDVIIKGNAAQEEWSVQQDMTIYLSHSLLSLIWTQPPPCKVDW